MACREVYPGNIKYHRKLGNIFLQLCLQRQLQKISRWATAVVPAAFAEDVTRAVAGCSAQLRTSWQRGQRGPVERVQGDEPDSSARTGVGCIISSEDYEVVLPVQAACPAAYRLWRAGWLKRPGVPTHVVTVDAR